ncbi:MAG: aminotransferase class III-fold pyridoxal phosphate-dependent enzyme [Halioglobus sp.]
METEPPNNEHLQSASPHYARPDHYLQYPIVLKSANGCHISDITGKEFLDLNSVMGSVSCGHNVDSINNRLIEQIGKLWNSNFLPTETQLEAISKINAILPPQTSVAALYSTGAEAIELALRLAREATGRNTILSFRDHFHGKTHGTMQLVEHFPDCYGPVPEAYRTVLESDGSDAPELLEKYLNALPAEDLAAVIFEPVIGYSGPRLLHKDFLKTVRKFCDKNNVVMIADEILTGFNRCDGWFYSSQGSVKPDVIVFGKGLGNGFPISGVACANTLFEHVNKALPGSTFAGNSLACAAACGVIDFMHQHDFPEKTRALEKVFYDYFSAPRFESKGVRVDGTGALLSIGFDDPSFNKMQDIYLHVQNEGVLTSHTQKYLRLMPPLTITTTEFENGIEIIGTCLDAFFAKSAKR